MTRSAAGSRSGWPRPASRSSERSDERPGRGDRLRHQLHPAARGRTQGRDPRAADAHHPAGAGRRSHQGPRTRRHRPNRRGPPRVPRGHGPPRCRAGPDDRHVGGAGCRQPRGLLRRRRGRHRGAARAARRRRRRAALLCRGDRRAAIRRRARGWSSTSAAGRPSSPSGRIRWAGTRRPVSSPSTSAASASPSVSCMATRPGPRSSHRPCRFVHDYLDDVRRELPGVGRCRPAGRPGRDGDHGRGRRDRPAGLRPPTGSTISC